MERSQDPSLRLKKVSVREVNRLLTSPDYTPLLPASQNAEGPQAVTIRFSKLFPEYSFYIGILFT